MAKKQLTEELYRSYPDYMTLKQLQEMSGLSKEYIRKLLQKQNVPFAFTPSNKTRKNYRKIEAIKALWNIEIQDIQKSLYDEYLEYFKQLLLKAWKKNPVEFLYTITSVSGMHFGHWDPTDESLDFFTDFTDLLKQATRENKKKRQYRIALTMYCHALEMSYSWHILMNTFRILNGEHYHIEPFIGERKEDTWPDIIPASANRKIQLVLQYAKRINEKDFVKYILRSIDKDIRNAVDHADFTITDLDFRWVHNLIAKSMPLTELDDKLTNEFALFEAFFNAIKWIKYQMAQGKKFHKWPNYEVLELMTNKEGVYGFKVHFSNGQIAQFSREKDQVLSINVMNMDDGSINFMAGNLDELKSEWIVNGKPFIE